MIYSAILVAKEKLTKAGLASLHTLRGCKPEEIEVIRSSAGLRLPQCYCEFLTQMGRSAGEFLVGYDWTFPKMLHFRASAVELVRESGSSYVLPTHAFVYLFDPAGAFLYFLCEENADPEIFMFIESEPHPRKVFESFSEWLLAVVDDEIAIQREREERQSNTGRKARTE